jgi:hypothetical protein
VSEILGKLEAIVGGVWWGGGGARANGGGHQEDQLNVVPNASKTSNAGKW